MKTLATTVILLGLVLPSVASEEDDLTSLSYISYLERYATIEPASADENIEAAINMPLVVGDRVDTAREARMEIVLADGSILWLDEYTTVSIDAVAYSRDTGGRRTVLYLVDGKIMIEVPEHVLSAEPIRIDGSQTTVYLNQPGVYRVEVLRSGGLRVEVWQGLAEAATTAGGVLVKDSTAAEVRSGEVTGVEPHLTWGDDFARWVEQRRQVLQGESSQYVDARYGREAAALDNYGTWVYVDATQSWAWQPAVGADWRPYTAGRWYWTSTGWSWVSYEPWGWLPYHYGSWYFTAGFGWVWGWGSVWSPAWVSWCYWPGYVGWCPWGYYNTWCWNRWGWGWGGYYPPVHPAPPIAGQPRPPRGDVIPPRDGVGPGDSGRRQTPEPSVRASAEGGDGQRRVTPGDGGAAARAGDETLRSTPGGRNAADFTGRVRVAEMDQAGWNVVSADDFASEHLSRVVQPGSRVMPDQGDRTGVVVTGPLTTRSPNAARTADELSRTFADVSARTDRDITRVMARDDSLGSEELTRLVQPTSLSELGRSSAQSTVASRPSSGGQGGLEYDAPSSRSQSQPTLSTGESSPFRSSSAGAFGRYYQPNIYRPGRTSSSGGSSSRTLVDPGSSPLLHRGSRPTTSSGGEASSGRNLPSTRSSSSPIVRQPVTSRAGVGRTSPYGSSSRPVIVPRTSPSRPSRSVGSRSPYVRPPSSVRSGPSGGRSSVSSRSSRAPSRGYSSGSSSRSSGARSAAPSRSSAGSSSAPRSSASSGGSRSSSSSGSRRR
jgi:hypothetical protein